MAAVVDFIKTTLNIQKREAKCLILGLDAAGKTSLLYRCRLGHAVTVIPTIGFNVETLKCGKQQKDVDFWDVGGCDKIRPLVRHYFSRGMAMLFVLDIHDDDRLDEAMQELAFQVREAVAGDHDPAFLGILLNKQDLPGSTPARLEKCREAIEKTIERTGETINWRIFDSEGLSGQTGVGIDEVLEAVSEGIQSWKPRSNRSIGNPNSKAIEEKPPTRDELVRRVQSLRTRHDVYEYQASFLSRMDIGSLATWDHGDHLFVAYTILQSVLKSPSGTTTPQQPTFLAVDEFLGHLAQMLQASPGKFRNTLHRTLTTFWVYQMYIALQKTEAPRYNGAAEDFFQLLEKNPHLMHGGLWKEYYTKDDLFSPKAKDHFLMPDKNPLPKMLSKDTSKVSKNYDSKRNAEDHAARRLKRWAYATLQTVKATGGRRGTIVKNALIQLQTDTIRQRTRDSNIDPYSETQAYFWIQIVHAAMEGVLRKSPTFNFVKISYETFNILYPDALGPDDIWKEYYQDSDWKGIHARVNFIPPKKGKVIPNVTPIAEIEQDWQSAVSEVRIPTMEELMQRANWISKYPVKKTETPQDPKPKSAPPESADIEEDDGEDDEWVDVLAITKKTAQVKISRPEAQPDKSIEPQSSDSTGLQSWKEHAELLRELYDNMPKAKRFVNHKYISTLAYKLINNEEQQLTRKTFWVRMVVEAYVDMYGSAETFSSENLAEDDGNTEFEVIDSSFEDFLSKNLELCWEDLWLLYYTELTWTSINASESIIGCDRKALRSVRGWNEPA